MQKPGARKSNGVPEPQRPNPFAVIPDPETVFSMPLTAPLLGPPPGRFRDGETITSQYRTDFAALSAIVPKPLEPINDTVMVQISRWGDVAGLGRNTFECNIMVAARFRRGGKDIVGSYSPYFFVDNDRAMAGGREFHGQPKRLAEVTIAYEPIWAIGTGKVATPEQAQEAIAFIRALVGDRDRQAAERVRILYGGSVKPENAAELLALPDVDGALVGGASLDAESFAEIVAAAAA